VGLTASFFGLGATLSNFLGQMVVEKFGHIASLTGSLVLSFAPLLLFSMMPETLGQRGVSQHPTNANDSGRNHHGKIELAAEDAASYVPMT
jgi:hypothetical protein